jgi:anti-sigma regulatory factor (Ser/Thr protein kinase)
MSATDPAKPGTAQTTGQLLELAFNTSTLYGLRAAVAAHGAAFGLTGLRLNALLVVASELATNAIRYAGGEGTLRLWRTSDAIFCQVTDAGPGIPDPENAGLQKVPAEISNGRGLWIVRKFTSSFVIENHDPGTTVTVSILLRPFNGGIKNQAPQTDQ